MSVPFWPAFWSLLVVVTLAGAAAVALVRRRGRRGLPVVRAARPGWWVVAAHVVPGLYQALVLDGRYVPELRRPRRRGMILAAGAGGIDLWDARAAEPLVELTWHDVAAVVPGPPAPTAHGTLPALRLTTMAGASLPIVLASGRGWSSVPQDEVDVAAVRLRELRDRS